MSSQSTNWKGLPPRVKEAVIILAGLAGLIIYSILNPAEQAAAEPIATRLIRGFCAVGFVGALIYFCFRPNPVIRPLLVLVFCLVTIAAILFLLMMVLNGIAAATGSLDEPLGSPIGLVFGIILLTFFVFRVIPVTFALMRNPTVRAYFAGSPSQPAS